MPIRCAEEQEGRSGEAYIADAKAANPQGRLIQPGEIGALAAFLCRDEALGITIVGPDRLRRLALVSSRRRIAEAHKDIPMCRQ